MFDSFEPASKLLEAARAVVESSDNAGCDDDLTVASAGDVAALKAAIEGADEVRRFSEDQGASVAQARADYAGEDIQIDDDPVVCDAGDAVWVSAWVRVEKDEADDDEV